MTGVVRELSREPSGPRLVKAPGERVASGVSSYRAGQVIYHQDEPAGALFIVVAGRVRLYRAKTEAASLLAGILGVGAPFGLDCMTSATYTESARAETE